MHGYCAITDVECGGLSVGSPSAKSAPSLCFAIGSAAMKRLLWIAFLMGCGGSHPTATPVPPRDPAPTPVGGSPAPPNTSVPDAIAPDRPVGAAATRDAELATKAAAYFDAFTNTEPRFTRDGKRLVFLSDRDGLPQLYLAGGLDQPATRIVTSSQRISTPRVTTENKSVIFGSDTGADENWSFFRVGLDGKNLVELTPGAKLQRDDPFIPDGKPSTLYFSARPRTSPATTLYTTSATSAGDAHAFYTDPKPGFLVDVSADGKTALFLQLPSESDNVLWRVDVATGKATRLFPAAGDKPVTIHDARFSRDGKRVLLATDHGEEAAILFALDTRSAKQLARRALVPATAAITSLTVAKEGGLLAVSLIVGNHAEIRILSNRNFADRTRINLPPGKGMVGGFSEDGKQLAFQWSTPSAPTDIYVADTATGKITARHEPRSSPVPMPATVTHSVDIKGFDGNPIPTTVYLGFGEETVKHPVIVSYHGGPAGVSMIRWNPATAFLISLGYVVVEPNVRGSSGYGRAFEAADNGPRRLDAFKDIETSARWAASQPWADKNRMVVFGGSYGGYTTLIALSRWPDIWRAGVDAFGIVDLETFMATTAGLIRELFLVEFGDPDKDGAFLASISPLADVAKIVDPLFVYAGANDPRVPRSESDQIVRALRGRHVAVEYMVAADEGHSLARRGTQLEFYSRVARFLETALR